MTPDDVDRYIADAERKLHEQLEASAGVRRDSIIHKALTDLAFDVFADTVEHNNSSLESSD